MISIQDYSKERITKSEVIFDKFNYKSEFILDQQLNINSDLSQPNAIFKEKIKFNNNSIRINEHELYMNSRKYITGLAQNSGFSLLSINKMNNIDYNDNYLYTFIKPN